MADRQLLIAKQETVYGTDITPGAADTIWCENFVYTPRGTRLRADPHKPGLSPVKGQLTAEYAEVTFDVPLAASGVAGTAPKWGPLMKACAWGETIVATTSVTYALITDTSAATSMTIVWREGLRLHKLLGSRGRVGVAVDANQRPVLRFAFKGLHVLVTAGAALVHADATWTGWVDALPIAQGRTTFSYNAVNLPLWSLSAEQNDNVLFRDLPHQENVQIVGKRAFAGSMKVKTPVVGTLSFESLWQLNTDAVLALVHGTVAGQIVTINGRSQNNEPSYSDEAGEDCVTVPLEFVSSALSTDNDLAIVLT